MYDKKTNESINNYNRIAGEYDYTFDGRFTNSLKHEIVKRLSLKRGYKVLDVACGNGTLLEMLNQKEEINAFGIDVSDEMIVSAKKRHPGFDLRVGSSAQLPYEDNYFDIVTVCAAFHHFSEPNSFLVEAKRVLKKGGELCILDPFFPIIIRQLSNLIIPLMKMGDVKIYSQKELEHFFSKNSISIIEVRRVADHGLMIIGSKT